MNDVLIVFSGFTGLEWYPDPVRIAENKLWQEAVETVDEIIGLQAKGLRLAHRTAEQAVDRELVPAATYLFEAFQQRLDDLAASIGDAPGSCIEQA